MLGIGSAGMVRQLFLVPKPDLTVVWVCIGLMLGPAVFEAWWRARNSVPAAAPETSSSSSRSQ
jgi:hypothetical protein